MILFLNDLENDYARNLTLDLYISIDVSYSGKNFKNLWNSKNKTHS